MRMNLPSRQQPLDENLVAAIALGKTIAFLVYSFVAALLTMAITILYIEQNFPRPTWNVASWVTFATLEVLTLWLVICGVLPASGGARARAFSERQAALGLAVMSCVPWFLYTDEVWFMVYMWGVNGTLLLVAFVYFMTKSFLSRSLRMEVLAILPVPLAQLLLGWLVDA
jgi:hypothetical protein